MADTSTAASISVASATVLTSPSTEDSLPDSPRDIRRPSLDEITPNLVERVDRYMKQVNEKSDVNTRGDPLTPQRSIPVDRRMGEDSADNGRVASVHEHELSNGLATPLSHSLAMSAISAPSPVSNFSFMDSASQDDQDTRLRFVPSGVARGSEFDLQMLPGETEEAYLERLFKAEKELKRRSTKPKRGKSKKRSLNHSRSKPKRTSQENTSRSHHEDQQVAHLNDQHQVLLLQNRNQSLRNELFGFFESYEAKVQDLKEELLLARAEVKQAKKAKQTLLSDNAKLKAEVTNIVDSSSDLHEIVTENIAEKMVLQKELETTKEAINEHKIQVQDKASQIRKLRESLTLLENKVRLVEEEKKTMGTSTATKEQEVEALKKQVQEMEALRKANVEKSEAAVALSTEILSYKELNANLRTEVEELKAKHDEACRTYTTQVETLQEVKTTSGALSQRLESELSLSRKEVEVKTTEVDVLKREKADLEKEGQQRKTEFESLQAVLAEKEKRIDAFSEKVGLLEAVAQARAEKEQSEQIAKSLQQSLDSNIETTGSNASKQERSVQFDESTIKIQGTGYFEDQTLSKEQQLLRKVEMLETNNLKLITQIKDSRVRQAALDKGSELGQTGLLRKKRGRTSSKNVSLAPGFPVRFCAIVGWTILLCVYFLSQHYTSLIQLGQTPADLRSVFTTKGDL